RMGAEDDGPEKRTGLPDRLEFRPHKNDETGWSPQVPGWRESRSHKEKASPTNDKTSLARPTASKRGIGDKGRASDQPALKRPA
ncbi:MAG: hypothetical protein JXB13_12315, partial [Phycisphaerae bacterium]|nr:hypothetical protein [Phycisphaerae bacterium]